MFPAPENDRSFRLFLSHIGIEIGNGFEGLALLSEAPNFVANGLKVLSSAEDAVRQVALHGNSPGAYEVTALRASLKSPIALRSTANQYAGRKGEYMEIFIGDAGHVLLGVRLIWQKSAWDVLRRVEEWLREPQPQSNIPLPLGNYQDAFVPLFAMPLMWAAFMLHVLTKSGELPSPQWGAVGMWLASSIIDGKTVFMGTDKPIPLPRSPKEEAKRILKALSEQQTEMPWYYATDALRVYVEMGKQMLASPKRTREVITSAAAVAGLHAPAARTQQQGDDTPPVIVPLTIVAALAIAREAARTGKAQITVPTADGTYNLAIRHPLDLPLAWAQVSEFVLGNITRAALDWLTRGTLPARGIRTLLSSDAPQNPFNVQAPPEYNPALAERLSRFADAAVRRAYERRRYVPSPRPFVVEIDKSLDVPLFQSLGIKSLAIWPTTNGLWVQIVAPKHAADGLTVFWRANQRPPRIVPLLLMPWLTPYIDVVLAMLWHDLVTAGESVLQPSPTNTRRRGASSGTASPPTSPSPKKRKRRRARSTLSLPRPPIRFVRWSNDVPHRGGGHHASPRPHWVDGHSRRLPEGYHRSPRAERLAQEYGFILPDDPRETFVVPHIRGGKGERNPEASQVRARGLLTLQRLFADEQ